MQRHSWLAMLGGAGAIGTVLLGSLVALAQTTSSTAISPEAAKDAAPLQPSKSEADRLAFDRLLVEAAILRSDFEDAKRGRSRTPVSLSAYRSMELRLGIVAAAEPANSQAREMAETMRQIQMQILGPSVMRAAVADRRLYADEMSSRLKDQQTKVSVDGGDSSTVRFVSPGMTKQRAQAMAEQAKIFEQAKTLQFRRVIFSDGRRTALTQDFEQPRMR